MKTTFFTKKGLNLVNYLVN